MYNIYFYYKSILYSRKSTSIDAQTMSRLYDHMIKVCTTTMAVNWFVVVLRVQPARCFVSHYWLTFLCPYHVTRLVFVDEATTENINDVAGQWKLVKQRTWSVIDIVAVCTDLWGKEMHRQVGVGTMVTSGSLRGVMVAHWPRNARDVGSIPTLCTMFPIFIAPTTIW